MARAAGGSRLRTSARGPRATRGDGRGDALARPGRGSPAGGRLSGHHRFRHAGRVPRGRPATETRPATGRPGTGTRTATPGQGGYGSQAGYGRDGTGRRRSRRGRHGRLARSPAGTACPAGRAAPGLRGRRRARGEHRRRGDRRVRRPPRGPGGRESPPARSPGRTTTRRAAEPPRRRSTRRRCRKKVDPGLVDIMSNLKYNGETAEGTGMIISASGLVLTNNHVIDGATTVRANLVTSSDQSYRGQGPRLRRRRRRGAAPAPGRLRPDPGDASVTPRRSAWAPRCSRSATPRATAGPSPRAGIINALDRSIQASDEGSNSTENLNHMLQTNARIQQGDSGGALANNAGQVIGMITAANTGSSSQSSSGGTLGFAIPINSALAIARQIASRQPSATVHIGLPGFLGVEVATSDSSNPQQQAADEAQDRPQRPDGRRGQRLFDQQPAVRRPGAGRAGRGGSAHRRRAVQHGGPVGGHGAGRRDHVGIRPADHHARLADQHHRQVPPGRRGFRAVGEPRRDRAHHQMQLGEGPAR